MKSEPGEFAMQSHYQQTVAGTFNYAADKNDGGEFSNTRPERSRQNLRPVDITIRNGRTWSQKPTLGNEGLMITDHSSGKADWSNRQWIDSEYVPSCVELIKKPAQNRRYRYTRRYSGALTLANMRVQHPQPVLCIWIKLAPSPRYLPAKPLKRPE